MHELDLIIWDMDGTLLQSTTAVPDSFIETASNYGHPGYTRDEIYEFYRLGVPENVVAHLLGRKALAVEMDFFYDTLRGKADVVSVYSGIIEALGALQSKIDLAVFTGASRRSADILLKATELTPFFKHIEGGDNYPPKPDPGGIVAVAEMFECSIDRVAYVGDAPYDMEAANSAGALGFAAGWGHLVEPNKNGCVVLEQPIDLLKLLSF